MLENASTREVNVPTVGVTPTVHIDSNKLAEALISRQQPTFADVYQNTDMRDVMKNADNNASAGREQILKTNTELTKAAIDAAIKAAELATGEDDISKVVKTLAKLGYSDEEIGKIIKNSDGNVEQAYKLATEMRKGKTEKKTDEKKTTEKKTDETP